jgi:hypothetical protein
VVTAIGMKGKILEFAMPLTSLGEVRASDEVLAMLFATRAGREVVRVPSGEPMRLRVR